MRFKSWLNLDSSLSSVTQRGWSGRSVLAVSNHSQERGRPWNEAKFSYSMAIWQCVYWRSTLATKCYSLIFQAVFSDPTLVVQ